MTGAGRASRSLRVSGFQGQTFPKTLLEGGSKRGDVVRLGLKQINGQPDLEPNVREEFGGALCVHSPKAPPIVLPSKGVQADVFHHPSNGWERPKQAGWEFREPQTLNPKPCPLPN